MISVLCLTPENMSLHTRYIMKIKQTTYDPVNNDKSLSLLFLVRTRRKRHLYFTRYVARQVVILGE